QNDMGINRLACVNASSVTLVGDVPCGLCFDFFDFLAPRFLFGLEDSFGIAAGCQLQASSRIFNVYCRMPEKFFETCIAEETPNHTICTSDKALLPSLTPAFSAASINTSFGSSLPKARRSC